jgi:N-acetylglucosaminyl-diphospho-decaprenol L-rhamnosyltransferase
VVGFRNPTDIADCLRALAKLSRAQAFEVLIVENGGDESMSMLLKRLDNGDLVQRQDEPGDVGLAVRPASKAVHLYRLPNTMSDTSVYVRVAQAPSNLGYGAGINFWLRPLLEAPGWTGIWVLNPDTMPMPQALVELITTARRRHKGMVGSCLVDTDRPGEVATRGLHWNSARARVEGIGHGAPISEVADLTEIEDLLWAPSGASFYVTRALIEQIGLMEERYFLYFEDLDWGMKARHLGQLTHAPNSMVLHKHGTTIGSSSSYRSRSTLSEYLETRNLILFVRTHFPQLVWWAVIMRLPYIARYGVVGALINFRAGIAGLVAGLRGHDGPVASP